jgi:hypothetical protein
MMRSRHSGVICTQFENRVREPPTPSFSSRPFYHGKGLGLSTELRGSAIRSRHNSVTCSVQG